MRSRHLVIGLVFLALSAPADAALHYEFRQTSRSDYRSTPPQESIGTAVIDGANTRIDFLTGSGFGKGNYVISQGTTKKVLIVDPSRKSYTELDLRSVAQMIGSSQIAVTNLKKQLTKLDDRPVIAGHPTEHHRLELTYDITLTIGGLSLKQGVRTLVDKWTTPAFGDVAEMFLTGGSMQTGNAELDSIIEAESTQIKGFALKQLVNVTTTNDLDRRNASSPLKIGAARHQTSELVITSIQERPAQQSFFQIPPEFQKVEKLASENEAAKVQTLDLQEDPGTTTAPASSKP